MSWKSLLELFSPHRTQPVAAAVALPAAAASVPNPGPRVMRRALPRRSATLRQMELDFRPGSRASGPAAAAPSGAAQDDNG